MERATAKIVLSPGMKEIAKSVDYCLSDEEIDCLCKMHNFEEMVADKMYARIALIVKNYAFGKMGRI